MTSSNCGSPTPLVMLAPAKKLLEQLPAPFSPAATLTPPNRSGGRLRQRSGGRSGSRSARDERSETDSMKTGRLRPGTCSGLPDPVTRSPRRWGQGRPGPPGRPPASALTSAMPRSSPAAARSMIASGQVAVPITRSRYSAPPGPEPALRGGARALPPPRPQRPSLAPPPLAYGTPREPYRPLSAFALRTAHARLGQGSGAGRESETQQTWRRLRR